MKIILQKQHNNSFNAMYDSDFEVIEKLPKYTPLECTIKEKPRSYPQLKLYWAVIKFTLHNLPEMYEHIFKSKEDLHCFIKHELGYRTSYFDIRGKVHYNLKSISFDTMKQSDFNEFMEKMFDLIILKYFFPEMDKETIIDGLIDFM